MPVEALAAYGRCGAATIEGAENQSARQVLYVFGENAPASHARCEAG